MGYNLWLSEDVAYTLGHRMGPKVDERQARAEEPARLSRDEADHIDMLMVEVARRLDERLAKTA